MLKRAVAVAMIAGVAALACARDEETPSYPPPSNASIAKGTDSSLYRRLGGYDALAAVTDSFLVRINGDTAISVFFAGIEPQQMNHIRQMVVDQLCAATGGPCLYVGKPMKEAHATLDITNAVFEKFLGHLQATLAQVAVPQREQEEVMAALRSLRTDIVTR